MSAKKLPTARVVPDANPEKSVTDADGRMIKYRTLNVLDQFRLALAMGADKAENSAAMRIATVAAMVTEIDGLPCPQPHNYKQIENAIGKLGDAGLIALVQAADADAQAREAAGPLAD